MKVKATQLVGDIGSTTISLCPGDGVDWRLTVNGEESTVYLIPWMQVEVLIAGVLSHTDREATGATAIRKAAMAAMTQPRRNVGVTGG